MALEGIELMNGHFDPGQVTSEVASIDKRGWRYVSARVPATIHKQWWHLDPLVPE